MLLSIGCETIATGFGVPWNSGLSFLMVILTVPLAFYIGYSLGWLLFVAKLEQSGLLADMTPLRQLVLLGMLYLIVLWLLYRLLIVAWDEQAANHYADIRASLEKAGRPVGAMYMLIAAHARSMGGNVGYQQPARI